MMRVEVVINYEQVISFTATLLILSDDGEKWELQWTRQFETWSQIYRSVEGEFGG